MSAKRSICFCINNNYVKHCCITISSIVNHNPYLFDFHIISSDLTTESKELLTKVVGASSISFHSIDISTFQKCKLTIDHTTIETYFRYLIPELLPQLDRVLYLDVDIIVQGDISELFKIDLKDYYVAGVIDTFIESQHYKATINYPESAPYINAGVLLLNLKKIRSDNIYNTLIDNTIKLQDSIKFQDQDIINLTFSPSIKPIDKKYNYTSHLFLNNEKFLTESAIIVHYTGVFKPWTTKITSHPPILLYYNAVAKSPFATLSLKISVLKYAIKRLFFSKTKLSKNTFEISVLGFRLLRTRKASSVLDEHQ